MVFEAYIDQWDTHVHFRLFVGEKVGALGLAGKLCMRENEFIDFCASRKIDDIKPEAMKEKYLNKLCELIEKGIE